MHHEVAAQVAEGPGIVPGQEQRGQQQVAVPGELESLQDLVPTPGDGLIGAEQCRRGQEVLGIGTVPRLPVLEHPVEGIELARSRARSQFAQFFGASTSLRAWSRSANFCTLPVGVIGSSLTISRRSGSLWTAMRRVFLR